MHGFQYFSAFHGLLKFVLSIAYVYFVSCGVEATVQSYIVVIFGEKSGWDCIRALVVWNRPLIGVNYLHLRAMGNVESTFGGEPAKCDTKHVIK